MQIYEYVVDVNYRFYTYNAIVNFEFGLIITETKLYTEVKIYFKQSYLIV